MEKMVGPRVWILVIGLLVFLTNGGECAELPPVKLVNEGCCQEDFDKFYAPVVAAYKNDPKSEGFKKALTAWVKERDDKGAKLDDLCGGRIGYKCEGTKDKATCSCNAETGNVAQDNICVVEKGGDPCTPKDPCKKGMHCEGEPIGVCAEGAVVVVEPGTGKENGTESGGDKGTASYTPRPIMWVIIGGLALIPAASS